MPHVQVRNVPDDVHAELVRRAERAGQSLQQYLGGQLAAIARTPSIDEVIERLSNLEGGRVGFAESVAALDAERRER